MSETKQYGNPQLGKGDPLKPNIPIYDAFGGKVIGHTTICEFCGGYYWALCPCGGRRRKNNE